MDLPTRGQLDQLASIARERRWGPVLIIVGWLHLIAFSSCYYLTVGCDYHDSAGYLAIWLAELAGMALAFRLCGGARPRSLPAPPLERIVRQVWIAYFILAFDLASLNTLRGHGRFEFFPAFGTLASFAFMIMTVLLDRRFFAAVLVMFASGLLMAAYFTHAYLIFAIAWWLVLNGIGAALWLQGRVSTPSPTASNARIAANHPAAAS